MAESYAILHPYPTVSPGCLQLDFERTSLPESAKLPTDRTLDVHDVENPFDLSFQVSFDRKGAEKQLELGKDLREKVRLVITAVGKEARIRKEIYRGRIDDSAILPNISFDPNDYRGRVAISAFLVYSSGEYQNIRCGESEPLLLQFDPYQSLPGSDIDWRWVDFNDPANNLTKHSDQSFCLKADTDPPILYLNESIDQFYGIMTAGARKGAKARLRDGISYQIASQVWQALLMSTLTKLADHPLEELSSTELIGEFSPWQKSLITGFARETWPLGESTTQLDTLIERLADGHDLDQIMVRETSDYVQELLQGGEPLTGFVKEFLEVSAP